MSASKLSDLLPIRASDIDPNPYQVFGLKAGERDAVKVQEAMQEVYARLKDAKSTADPEIWKQALRMAESARKLLGDPERRCALDASLEAAGLIDSPKPSGSPGATDPLAGLLPSAQSVAPMEPGSPQTGAASAVLGMPPMPNSPSTSSAVANPLVGATANPNLVPKSDPQPASGQASTAQQPTQNESGAINWAPPKSEPKRRKNNSGVFLFGVFVLLMFGAIIGLLRFLSSGGRIAVTKSGAAADGGVIVSKPMDAPGPETPRAKKTPKNGDGVLGPAPTSGAAKRNRNPKRGSGIGKVDPLRRGMPLDTPAATMQPQPSMAQEPANPPRNQTPPMMPTPPPKVTSNQPGPDEPIPDEPTPAMVKSNQSAIEEVEQLIRSANWKEMKPAAEALLDRKLTSEQSNLASSLFDIADLSGYYRLGIERGLATLEVAETFEITDGLPVIVVKATADSLSIRYNKKTQTYSLDDLPPRLTERIAAFGLDPEQPDSIAGLALYRLIHPKTNEEYRRDAFELLSSVDGRLKSVDSTMLQKVAQKILSK